MTGLIELYCESSNVCHHRFIFEADFQQKANHAEYEQSDITKILGGAEAVIKDFFGNWLPKLKAEIYVDDGEPLCTYYHEGPGSWVRFSRDYVKGHDGPYYLEDMEDML